MTIRFPVDRRLEAEGSLMSPLSHTDVDHSLLITEGRDRGVQRRIAIFPLPHTRLPRPLPPLRAGEAAHTVSSLIDNNTIHPQQELLSYLHTKEIVIRRSHHNVDRST